MQAATTKCTESNTVGGVDAISGLAQQAPVAQDDNARSRKDASTSSLTGSSPEPVALRSAAEIRDAAAAFVASGERRRTLAVRSHLRRSMGVRASIALGHGTDRRKPRRSADNQHKGGDHTNADDVCADAAIVPPPGVNYVCLGTGEVLWLRMTLGAPEPLLWSDLCDRTRKAFAEAAGLVLPTTYRDGRPVPSIDAADLDAVEPFVGLRSRWMPLLDKAVCAIGSERSLNSLHEAVKTDVRNWVARNGAIARWAAQEPIIAPQLETTPTWDGSPPVYKHSRFTRGHYAVQNTGRHFVSVDMRAASHAVLLVEGLIEAPTWRDLVILAASAPKAAAAVVVGNDDLLDYVVSLKKLRASALAVGSGHGRQMALMARVMAQLFERLVNAAVVTRTDLAHFGRDELVFHVADFADAAAKISAIQATVHDDRWAPHLAYSAYRMEEVGAETIGYVLVHEDGHHQLKCVDGAHAAEYARLWHRRIAETPRVGYGYTPAPLLSCDA
ncbi:hypothetical protein pqer_cds_964 [Pandoravirus quercus]|uniref:Uncharacterized protein n=1 Tax=Pandoravirus quercus TaxID=2107709 RepID=A0A2U7UAD5_9VIRU|nr:hypothetical protein pqer_cds_964 [Pandoravirus quercus]AVK75386.1 hypothetical protein pqer_cds_964 [Pandoravirus quercus]